MRATTAAGTGKTLLGLRKALSFAQEGKVFLCYNANLAASLATRVSHERLKLQNFHGLKLQNFHGLCRELTIKDRGEFPVPHGVTPEENRKFWSDGALNLLDQAIDRTGVRYDAIVVDEGQS